MPRLDGGLSIQGSFAFFQSWSLTMWQPALRVLPFRGGATRFAHTATEASSSIPPPRGNIKEPADFLKAIGRGCDEFADKFEENLG
ncbi:hypothetical protein VTP01DRAFT_10078 [Rhizomucor pusillus]|uniref:uncharacterized protein n=1 Tax=Rhizomucor pusillus TaxID=4840 RepID=UPI003742B7E7